MEPPRDARLTQGGRAATHSAMSLTPQTRFEADHGTPVPVAPDVVRITARNEGPMTFTGTNSYLVGSDRLVLVDPGPDDDAHLTALLRAIGGRPVDAILVTHTHLDHTGLAARLRETTGAPLVAEGPHRAARTMALGETNPLDDANDLAFRPDRCLADGETLPLPAGRFVGVATPGHTVNHMAFAIEGTGLLFSGDHVMGWATSVVAPPDGSMGDYMRSLRKLAERAEDRRYLPGHGGAVEDPAAMLRAMTAHRRMREASIRERLRAGDRSAADIVAAIYRTTDPKLHGAAALSVLAHLEDLAERGLVRLEGTGREVRAEPVLTLPE